MIGLWGAVLMLSRGMFGIGALSMPYMFILSGPWIGLLLLLLFAANSTAMAAVLVASAPTASSYEEATGRLCGRGGEIFLAANILLANLGTCAAYLSIAAQRLVAALAFWGILPAAAAVAPGTGEGWRLGAVFACVVLASPLALPARLVAARGPSAVSLLLAAAVAAAVVGCSQVGGPQPHGKQQQGQATLSSALRGVPLSCYAFSAMSQVFPVYSELEPTLRSPRTVARAAGTAALIAFVLYAAIGLSAARRFGAATAPDVLANFEQTDPPLFHALGAAYAAGLVLGVPLMLFPARRSLCLLLASAGLGPEQPGSPAMAAMAAGLLVVAFILAAASKNVLPILDVLGSVSAIVVDSVLPGILFLRSTAPGGAAAAPAAAAGVVGREEAAAGRQASLLEAADGREACHAGRPARGWPPCRYRAAVRIVVVVGAAAGVASFAQTVQHDFLGG